ncbi:toprim domain-containing protein [Roseomonas sp. 18066]|uniref:DUF7146 domain-containing protein n=1 Tax=Roseomonas sp. 18066 TaxID=2681412 RepID=UPI00135700E7|nr:toprim domain-containing protein [Roseomonas sp. 18066]
MKRDHDDQLTEVKRRLTDRIDELAEELFGPPARDTRNQKQWGWDKSGGLFVVMRGPKRGSFFHHAGGKGGGPLHLIMFAQGVDFSRALAWAKSWLGIGNTGARPPSIDPAVLQERQRKRQADEAHTVASERHRIGRAQSTWRYSDPIDGTIAELYLTQTRGVLRPRGGWPREAVRFHRGSCALVVAMTSEDGEVRAVQRIYLTSAGTKISAEEAKQRGLPGAKQTTGVMAGAMVRLPATKSGPLLIAEGPETALSVWSATGYETWAALGAVAKIAPPIGRSLIICADDDNPSSSAAGRLREALEGWKEEGQDVAVAYPWPEPRHDKSDFNDAIKEAGEAAVRHRIACAAPVVLTPTTPHYPRPRLSGAQASAKLQRVMRAFFDRVERQIEARDWIDVEADRLSSSVEAAIYARHRAKLLLDGVSSQDADDAAAVYAEKTAPGSARQRARRAARIRFGKRALGAAPRIQIAAAAGLGKTSAIIAEILRRPKLWHRNIYIYAKDLALCNDFEERFAKAARDTIPLDVVMRPRVLVIRGRQTRGMCKRREVAEAASRAGCSSVFGTVCHTHAVGSRPESFCPYWEWCRKEGYIAQFLDSGPAIRVMAQHRLGIAQPSQLAMPPPDLVIVDEGAINPLVESSIIEPSDVVAPTTYDCEIGEGHLVQEALDVAAHVRRGLQASEGVVDALRAADIDPALLQSASKAAVLSAEKAQPAVDAGFDDERALHVLQRHKQHPGQAIAEMFNAIARDLRAERKDCVAVEWDAEATAHREDGSIVPHPVIRLHQRRLALGAPSNTPLVLIDADAEFQINQKLFGADLRNFSIPAVRICSVTQISDHSLAKSSLAPGKKLPNNLDKAVRLLDRIADFVKRETGPGIKVLVITSREVRLALTGEEDTSDLPISLSWHGATVTHFGRHLGSDQWRDYDTIIVIGREQPPLKHAERTARGIWGDDTQFPPLDLPGTYGSEERRHDLRHGRAPAVKVQVHPCPRVQAIMELTRERGVGQAIDRLRLLFRTPDRPARVIVLTNLPVPGLIVDELLTLDEVLEGGTTVERALRDLPGGVLPLSSAWLSRQLSNLFPSERTARREVEKALYKWPLGNKNIYCEVATYTCPGQRRPSKALIRPDVADPQAQLAGLLKSEITTFRLVRDEAADAEVLEPP